MKKTILLLGIIVSASAIAFAGNSLISKKYVDSKPFNSSQEFNNKQDDEYILNFESNLDLAYDLSNKKEINNAFEYIALIKIDKIDGVDNYDSITKQYVSPYTYGKATILKVIKGEIPKSNISFRRLGGKISFEKMLEGDEAPEKLLRIREESGLANVPTKKIFVDSKISGDIDIEEGKVYLAFLEYNKEYNKENEYWIGGLQYGLREVDMTNKNVINDVNNIKIKNNENGKWEKLSTIADVKETK